MEMRLAQMNPRGPMADGELLVVAGWPGQPGVEITAAETDCAVGFGDRGMTVDGFDRMILAVSVLVERAARRHD